VTQGGMDWTALLWFPRERKCLDSRASQRMTAFLVTASKAFAVIACALAAAKAAMLPDGLASASLKWLAATSEWSICRTIAKHRWPAETVESSNAVLMDATRPATLLAPLPATTQRRHASSRRPIAMRATSSATTSRWASWELLTLSEG